MGATSSQEEDDRAPSVSIRTFRSQAKIFPANSSCEISKIDDFPRLGLKLTAFREFVEGIKRTQLEGLTTQNVCDKYLKVLTKDNQETYCEYLQRKGSPHVANANCFISHAWRYQFLEVVDAILFHFEDDPNKNDVIIWFDLFSNNQHIAPERDFTWWSSVFKSAIAEMGHTVLVLSPWDDPIPLTRAWCLFEIFCTIATKSKFSISMSENETKRFFNAVVYDFESINKLVANVDVAKSEAFHPSDRDKIFFVIQNSIGFSNINRKIFRVLRGWIIDTIKSLMDSGRLPSENFDWKAAFANFHCFEGNYELAIPLLRDSLASKKASLGINDLSTISISNSLAVCLLETRRFADARELFTESLNAQQRLLGHDHSETLSTMNNLAVLHMNLKSLEKAELLLKDIIAKSFPHFSSHFDARTNAQDRENALRYFNQYFAATQNLSKLCFLQNRLEEAEAQYQSILPHMTNFLGKDHVDRLSTLSNLAAVYVRRAEIDNNNTALFDKALELYDECHKSRSVKMGEFHPDTIDTLYSLASTLMFKGQYAEAKPILESCCECEKHTNGLFHENTSKAFYLLSDLYREMGDLAKAEGILFTISNILLTETRSIQEQHNSAKTGEPPKVQNSRLHKMISNTSLLSKYESFHSNSITVDMESIQSALVARTSNVSGKQKDDKEITREFCDLEMKLVYNRERIGMHYKECGRLEDSCEQLCSCVNDYMNLLEEMEGRQDEFLSDDGRSLHEQCSYRLMACMFEFSDLSYQLGDYESAQATLEDLKSRLETNLLKSLIQFKSNSSNESELNNLTQSEKIAKLYELMETIVRDNISSFEVLKNLANVLELLGLISRKSGDVEKSVELLQICSGIRLTLYTERNNSYLSSINNLGLSLMFVKRPEDAVSQFKKCFALRKEVSGESHPETISVESNLGIALKATGHFKEAKDHFEHCLRYYNDQLTGDDDKDENWHNEINKLNKSIAVCDSHI